MNKIVKIVMSTLVGTGCFSAGLYYATLEFEEQISKWDSNYQTVVEKVFTFEKVSNPKTIRRYVNDLNKILDDIDFLHTSIESGEITDEKLDKYLASQQGNVDGLKESLSSITTEVSSMLDSSHTHIHGMVEELQSDVKSQITDSVLEVTSKVNELNKQITSLENKLNDVNKVIDKIKNSKMSKYLK
jgi:chromosome segregation ATPase